MSSNRNNPMHALVAPSGELYTRTPLKGKGTGGKGTGGRLRHDCWRNGRHWQNICI